MPKDILPPKTPTLLSTAETNRIRSANREVFENIMVDSAEDEYLTQLGTDRGVPRPAAFFADDDLWRAVIKALAFNVRHNRNAVRRVVELVLAPYLSQATILNRNTNRNVLVGQTLGVTSGANIGNYTIVGITPHEAIFNAGTFAVIPEAASISYDIGPGTPPSAGATSGLDGFLYVHQDGTERFRDNTQTFQNYARDNILTALNKLMPQFGTVIFDMNSPFEETVTLAYYDNKEDGLAKLKGTVLQHTHTKSLPFHSSTLSARADTGDLTLVLRASGGANFPANAAGVPIVTVADSLEILEGPNIGTYAINTINGRQLNVVGALTVTGSHAQNQYRIKPIATPAGSKGTVLGRGGIVATSGGNSDFRDMFIEFDSLVDPFISGPPEDHNYSVVINRGEVNSETIEVTSRGGDILTLVLDPSNTLNTTSLLRFDHEIGESVEIANLPVLATGTYAPITATTITGIADGTDTLTLDDAAATFIATFIASDLELITAATFSSPRQRTIDNVPAGTQLTWIHPLPGDVFLGDTFRIIKRYKAGIDSILYVNDASGLPAANFTAIIDRGKSNEEVVWISTNTQPTAGSEVGFPWRLTLSNPATLVNDHGMDVTVESAQVLVQGCDWEIIETKATGEFTLLVAPACVPDLAVDDATYLHSLIPNLAAGTTAAITNAVTLGNDFIEMDLTGPNSYATAIETVGDQRQGEIFRPIVIDTAGAPAAEEFAFATRQRRFTKIATDFSIDGPSQTFIEVDDVTSFIGYTPGAGDTVEISRNSPHPDAGLDSLVFTSIDQTTSPPKINLAGPLTASHFTGDTVEIDPVELSVSFPLEAHGLVNVELLYTVEDAGVPRYKHVDPYDISKFINLHDGDIRDFGGESYYSNAGQTASDGIVGKPVYPGSYLLGLTDKHQTTINQPSSIVTRFATAHDPNNLDAMFRIPFQQQTTAEVGANLIGGGQILLDNADLFPEDGQNPFFVVIDRGKNIEERLEIGGKIGLQLNIDLTQTTKYTHAIGATIDLEISKLLLMSGAGIPDQGGLYLDYGFSGNATHIEDVQFSGTQTVVTDDKSILDVTQAFQSMYHSINALVGAKIIVRPAGPNTEIVTVEVLNETLLKFSPDLVVPIAPGEAYTVFASVEVDNGEVGTNTDHVGGVKSDLGAVAPVVGVKHPARTGGIVEEYVRYISKDNNVITLNTPRIFNFAHPASTEIIIGSNEYKPQGDGSDFPAYLVGNYLESVFNSAISSLPDLMRAAGIELKVEVKDA